MTNNIIPNNKKYIFSYLILTYLTSWILWGILAFITQMKFESYSSPFTMFLFLSGGVTPALSAISINKYFLNKEEFKKFTRKIIQVKSNLLWYIIIILLALSQSFLPFLIGEATVAQPTYMIIIMLPFMIIGGGLEEIGWRGLLLPILKEKFSSILSTIIIGFIWSIWHIPLWFITGTMQSSMMNFFSFFIMVMGFSFILSAIYIKTKNIFLCIITHALINSTMNVCIPSFSFKCSFVLLAFDIIIYILIVYCGNNKVNKLQLNLNE